MQHYWTLEDVHLRGAWLTIGSFDGVHRGHQEIVRNMTAGARAVGSPAVVLTFHPHPAVVLGKRNGPMYLTTPEERAELLGKMGVDVVISHPFTLAISRMTAVEFMQIVCDHLGLRNLWVGHDFALGRGREGDVPALRRLGEKFGYEVTALPPVEIDGQVISSSLIRSLITRGDVKEAARLLGRPHRIRGRVEPGDGRGRTIGIPTANLAIWEGLVLPAAGVYTARAKIGALDGETWGAVVNIGFRPTFQTGDPVMRVEAHLLDFQDDLYGKLVQLEFLARLRDEQRFPNVDALVSQIQADIQQARKILALH